MTVRSLVFWPHLVAGVLAGIVILSMSVTGVLLMYERQILAWADRGYRSSVPAAGAERLPLEIVMERVAEARPTLVPTAVTVRSDDEAPVVVAAGAQTVFVDAYSGAVIGEASRSGVRAAMSTLREWHRWFALAGEQRAFGRALTGWANLVFLFIVVSGAYLWLPRRWSWRHVRAVAWFGGGLRGRARDFNWHNTIGVWSVVPLFLIVISAAPISFPWANALLFRAVGETPPAPAGASPARAAAPPAREGRPAAASLAGLDAAWIRAEQQVPGWRAISLRAPANADAPFVFTIDRGDGGQPQLRDTLTVGRGGELVRFEPFASQTLGRRLRSIARFTHTGEVLGLAGQTVAGLASAGAVVLVWTGLSLAWRRFFGGRRAPDADRRAAA